MRDTYQTIPACANCCKHISQLEAELIHKDLALSEFRMQNFLPEIYRPPIYKNIIMDDSSFEPPIEPLPRVCPRCGFDCISDWDSYTCLDCGHVGNYREEACND